MMSVAVVLYFDKETENRIMDLWRRLYDKDICKEMIDTNSRPHISLAAINDASLDSVVERAREFSKQIEKIDVALTSISCFPGDAGVIYLAPKTTPELLDLHNKFHKSLEDYDSYMHKIYTPPFWVPHCTMTIGISKEKLLKGMELLLDEFKQIKGKLCAIGFVEFYPINYRHDKTIIIDK